MKALFLYKLADFKLDYLRKNVDSSVEFILPEAYEEAEIMRHAATADIAIGKRVTPEFLQKADRLKLFVNPGAGIEKVQPFLKPYSQKITFVKGNGNTSFVAQQAVALLFAVSNKIVTHDKLMRQGYWRAGDKEGKTFSLHNAAIGLHGYGNINKYVHQFLSGFTSNFHVLKRTYTPIERAKCYTQDQMDDFLKNIDILITAAPLTAATKGIFGEKELDLLGKEGIVINVGRGGLIDEASLYNALKARKIQGAGIDVWYDYAPKEDEEGRKFPYNKKYPFHDLDNLVMSPHRGASPYDSLPRWDDVIYNINQAATGGQEYMNLIDLKREY